LVRTRFPPAGPPASRVRRRAVHRDPDRLPGARRRPRRPVHVPAAPGRHDRDKRPGPGPAGLRRGAFEAGPGAITHPIRRRPMNRPFPARRAGAVAGVALLTGLTAWLAVRGAESPEAREIKSRLRRQAKRIESLEVWYKLEATTPLKPEQLVALA